MDSGGATSAKLVTRIREGFLSFVEGLEGRQLGTYGDFEGGGWGAESLQCVNVACVERRATQCIRETSIV